MNLLKFMFFVESKPHQTGFIAQALDGNFDVTPRKEYELFSIERAVLAFNNINRRLIGEGVKPDGNTLGKFQDTKITR